MNNTKRAEIFRRLQAIDQHPKTELEYATPFELLVAVTLSAQATDKSVNLATRKLFPIANTPEKIYALAEAGLKEFIKTIGLYQSKAKHIIQTCRILMDEHGSEVPDTREALERLPGVGRKTANVVLNVAFGQPTMAVDTPLEVEKKLLKHVPPEFMQHAHHWLILLGRYTCVARKPKCRECAIADLCDYKDKVLD